MGTWMFVNGDRFFFPDPAVLENVRAAIRAAVRSGGDFVRIGSATGPEMLITAATSVRIDTCLDGAHVLEDGFDRDADLSFVDFDHFTSVDI